MNTDKLLKLDVEKYSYLDEDYYIFHFSVPEEWLKTCYKNFSELTYEDFINNYTSDESSEILSLALQQGIISEFDICKTLDDYLVLLGIDNIEDDEVFCEEEEEVIYKYCKNRNYQLGEDDIETLRSRLMYNRYLEWKSKLEDSVFCYF